MGLMDGILGGVLGAGLVTAVQGFIEKQGGLPAVVAQFEKNGLGPTVHSWIGTGTNQPVTASQLQQVLGTDLVQQLAGKTGLSPADLLQKLSQVLPKAIDKMTPEGVIPKS